MMSEATTAAGEYLFHEFPVAGTWTYRSYHNDPAQVGNDPQKALALIFGEGVYTLAVDASHHVTGALDMGSGYVLDVTGERRHAEGTSGFRLFLIGKGRAGTPTAGWQYDYQLMPDPMWRGPGVDQVPAMVGTTLRAVPHNGEPAGVTASVIMVWAPPAAAKS
jgi:hypothetical protein